MNIILNVSALGEKIQRYLLQYQQTAQPQYQTAPQPQSMTYAPEHAADAIAAMQGNSQIGQGFMSPQEDDRPPFA